MLRLKYFEKVPNAGDQFSPIAARIFFSENIIECGNPPSQYPNLLLLGSILEWADSNSYVCGAGLISSKSRLPIAPKAINCVRGPLTAYFLEQQGFLIPRNYADPGVLVPELFPESVPITHSIGVIPHYVDLENPWLRKIGREPSIKIITPLQPFQDYIVELKQCETILSSSLHGLIFAHAYRKRAAWIELSKNVIGEGFKFYDYYLSVGISPEFVLRNLIRDDEKPFSIARIATKVNHDELKTTLLTSIELTKSQLKL